MDVAGNGEDTAVNRCSPEESEDEEVWGMLAGSAEAADETDQTPEDSEDEEVWGMLAGSAEAADESDETDAPCPNPMHVQESASTDASKCDTRPSLPHLANLDAAGCDTTFVKAAESQSLCCHAAPGTADGSVDVMKERRLQHSSNGCGCGDPSVSRGKSKAWALKKGGRLPEDILQDSALNEAIAANLPSNYDFEVHRTVWRLRRCSARHVGLQMPEGLTMWATALADILRRFVPSVEAATIFGDVSFGACCVDDLASRALGIDFLVHYGHSCLVPVDQTTVTMLYVHVEIRIDVDHLVETVCLNFAKESNLVFMGTVQFGPSINEAVDVLKKEFFTESNSGNIPQVRPLGVGETLGCTSPHVPEDADAVVFVCDGRFHLESAMIQNPHVKQGFFRYDPFYRTLTREGYAYDEMHRQRKAAIENSKAANFVGLILGTLGRQGSTGVLEELEHLLEAKGIGYFTLLLSEISPERLALFNSVDAWVQVACPRLSLDWGEAFKTPMLTPYEAHVAFGSYSYKDVYPMDYYSNKGGPWSNYGAGSGFGGSLSAKFQHLGKKKHQSVEYEGETELV